MYSDWNASPVSVTEKTVPHLHPRGAVCQKDYFNISHLAAQHNSLSSKAYWTGSNIQCYSLCVHKQTDKWNAPQPVCLYLPCREWGAFRCLTDLTPGIRFVCSGPVETRNESSGHFSTRVYHLPPGYDLSLFKSGIIFFTWASCLLFHQTVKWGWKKDAGLTLDW